MCYWKQKKTWNSVKPKTFNQSYCWTRSNSSFSQMIIELLYDVKDCGMGWFVEIWTTREIYSDLRLHVWKLLTNRHSSSSYFHSSKLKSWTAASVLAAMFSVAGQCPWPSCQVEKRPVRASTGPGEGGQVLSQITLIA